MQPQDLLIFRNYSGIEEPAISTPVGFLSIRNIMVFAIFAGIAFGLHKMIMPISIEFPRDFGLAVIVSVPFIAGILLAIIKPQFGSADSILLSIFYMLKNKNKGNDIHLKAKRKDKKKSTVLGFGKTLKKAKVVDADIEHEILCADLDELKSMRVQISYNDGSHVADKLVRCYIDDVLTDAIRTTFDGWVIIKIRPEQIGKRHLVIRGDDDVVLLEKTLHFKKK